MIGLLGANGYVGKAFASHFQSLKLDFTVLTREDITGKQPSEIGNRVKELGIDFLVNAAGFTGKPNVDACETQKQECLYGNAVLPGIISDAAASAGIPWGHVSSGCIYNGHSPNANGFTEDDEPNFSFRRGPCSFYSGTKALGEEVIESDSNCYVWRLRIPFNEVNNKRNYLTKVQRYDVLLDATNSLSHLGDYVKACTQCIVQDIEKGVYNLTNPGFVTTRQVVELLKAAGLGKSEYRFFESEQEFMEKVAVAPRSNCVLDSSKAINKGISLRPVQQALEESIENWVG